MNLITPRNWIHTFDIWGVLIDNARASAAELALYKEFAKKLDIPEETIQENLRLYNLAISGQAGDKKSEFLKPINDSVNRWFNEYPGYQQRSVKDMEECFYDDTTQVMRQIINSGERVALFTSATSNSANTAFQRKHGDLAAMIGAPYAWVKSVEGFKRLGEELKAKQFIPATHAEDELRYVQNAKESGVYSGALILVDRKGKVGNGDVRILHEQGIIATRDLRELDYTTLRRKQ